MKKLFIPVVIGVMLLAACNKGGSTEQASGAPDASKVLASAEASQAPVEKSEAKQDYEPQVGKELELEGDQKVTIISVTDLDEAAKEHEGLIALEGRVAESYPDKASFILVDCDNMKGCKDGCCPQARVPVRLSEAEGQELKVPGVDDFVIVLADLSLTETGYTLAVREVRPAKAV